MSKPGEAAIQVHGSAFQTTIDHKYLPKRVFLAVALLIALLATWGVVMLQRRADESRQAEVHIAHVEGLTNRLKRLELQVESAGHLDPSVAQQAQELRQEMARLLDQVMLLDRGKSEAQHVLDAFRGYQAANEQLFHLFATDQLEEAEEWDEEHSDPSYDALFEGITSAGAAYRDEARQAILGATVGSILMMAGALLLIGLLFWRFEQAQRTASVLVAEQWLLRRNEERFRSLVKNASDVIVILDGAGRVRYQSPATERILGYAPETLDRQDAWDLVHADDLVRAQNLLQQTIQSPGVNLTTELRLQHANGSWRNFEVIANNLLDDAAIGGIVVTYHDITEHKTFEDELRHLAFHDSLTNLPNRALAMDRLDRALARSDRRHDSVAVLFLDLDNFKVINDSLGHQIGDQLLLEVAGRLLQCVRPEDTVARIGGDEFTIVLEKVAGVDAAIHIAERIAMLLREPVNLGSHEFVTTASIGIALSRGQDSSDSLLRDADLAMYRAKTTGKASHAVFDHTMNARAMQRLELEAELRHALEYGELRVFYQPLMVLDTGRLSEVEALVRWEHPRRGLVAPGDFIPIAEETGLILPIGRWVLAEACRQVRAWQLEEPSDTPIILGVNLSARQFQSPDLVADIAHTLEETGLPAASLKLEITESVMMNDAEATSATLSKLKQLGVGLAVDDFGTGYSSLAYLQRFPLDVLKIDRSFVERLGRDTEADAIVRAIITLASTLNMSVTAEGIEEPEQMARLRDLGCDLGQGFLIARPGTGEATWARLAEPLAEITPV